LMARRQMPWNFFSIVREGMVRPSGDHVVAAFFLC
jgi:hypothetical protein